MLEEFQRNQLTPSSLQEIASKIRDVEGLDWKILDLAMMLRLYTEWLTRHGLKDTDSLLDIAAHELGRVPATPDLFEQSSRFCINTLWVDGFAEFSPQELEMLAALAPFCRRMTLTLCLDHVPREKSSWLSSWSVLEHTYFNCRKRLEAMAAVQVSTEVLQREGAGRFDGNPVLQHLERHWNEAPRGNVQHPTSKLQRSSKTQAPNASDVLFTSGEGTSSVEEVFAGQPDDFPIRIVGCKNLEAEAVFAAREILRHTRAGGRYREVAVLVRKLHDYHAPLQRTFTRYGIPFFLDRREPVAHHPAVELTRSALRTVALGWQKDDFFAALKTGFAPVKDGGIDRFENEALARGWQGSILKNPAPATAEPELEWLQPLLKWITRRFIAWNRLRIGREQADGPQLADALRKFWGDLKVEEQLMEWSARGLVVQTSNLPSSVHSTVWQGMTSLMENVELAFRDETVPIREWLPILEAAFANFSVGIIPPALDQVLVGTVDRSRDSEIKLGLVLGLNETVFPALPDMGSLLTETDRAELERHDALTSASLRAQLGRERYYAYLACTRARERLILTFASENSEGSQLNPSPFLASIRKLFPSVEIESPQPQTDSDVEHVCELIAPLMKAGLVEHPEGWTPNAEWKGLRRCPAWPRQCKIYAGLESVIKARSRRRLRGRFMAAPCGLRSAGSNIRRLALSNSSFTPVCAPRNGSNSNWIHANKAAFSTIHWPCSISNCGGTDCAGAI